MFTIPERLRPGLSIVQRLRAEGYVAYLVGGVVRDLLLGREPKDLDIVTSATPDDVIRLYPDNLLIGAAFGIVNVIVDGHPYEVATFRRDGEYRDGRRPESVEFSDEETDARRRDFSIGAMFWDPIADRLIDYVGGRKALEAKTVACVGDPNERFREDKLRMLRAIRFAVELDFGIDIRTFNAILLNHGGIVEVSAERIRDELVKILVSPRRHQGMKYLQASQLLKDILPEVASLDGIPQPREFHPEGDVLIHTVMTLETLYNPSPVLAMAAMLHDIGKPGTLEFSDRIRFNSHDELGAKMAGEICARLRFSAEETESIVWLVANHLRPKDVPSMHRNKAKRFLSHPLAEELLELHRSDRESSSRDLSAYNYCMELVAEMKANPPRLQLVTGKDLINLGFEPGPVFGTIIRAVEKAQDEGELSTAEEALDFVKKVYMGGVV